MRSSCVQRGLGGSPVPKRRQAFELISAKWCDDTLTTWRYHSEMAEVTMPNIFDNVKSGDRKNDLDGQSWLVRSRPWHGMTDE
jgi:hypothetical protein